MAHASPESQWIAAIAIMGSLHQLCAYTAVRVAVFQTGDLDEPVDAIIYAAAACLGVATATTLQFVTSSEGIMPLAGTAWISSVVLIHVTAALPLGLGIAQRRMGGSSVSLAFFFVLSVVMNGGLTEVLAMYGSENGDFRPWYLLGMAAALAAVVLVAGGIITDRLRLRLVEVDQDMLAKTHGVIALGRRHRLDFSDWLLGGGISYAQQQTPAAKPVKGLENNVSVTLPKGWTTHTAKTGFTLEQSGLGQHLPSVHFAHVGKAKDGRETKPTQTADILLFGMEQDRKKAGVGYRTLKVEERDAFGGHKTMWSHFAYLAENDSAHGESMPTLLRGWILLFQLIRRPDSPYVRHGRPAREMMRCFN